MTPQHPSMRGTRARGAYLNSKIQTNKLNIIIIFFYFMI